MHAGVGHVGAEFHFEAVRFPVDGAAQIAGLAGQDFALGAGLADLRGGRIGAALHIFPGTEALVGEALFLETPLEMALTLHARDAGQVVANEAFGFLDFGAEFVGLQGSEIFGQVFVAELAGYRFR